MIFHWLEVLDQWTAVNPPRVGVSRRTPVPAPVASAAQWPKQKKEDDDEAEEEEEIRTHLVSHAHELI